MGERGPATGTGGRPKGSGLGKYAGGEAKTDPAVRKYFRERYHSKKKLREGTLDNS